MAGPPRHSDRIAVVGGGIGGLAAAAFMRRAGLAATVYEQASALGEVGAGLIVAPKAARLLRRLPSAVELERVGVVLETGWEFRRWADGSVLFAQQLGEACDRPGQEAACGDQPAPLVSAKYLLLTTFTRDGAPLATPVRALASGDRAYFRTGGRVGRLEAPPAHRLGPGGAVHRAWHLPHQADRRCDRAAAGRCRGQPDR